MATNAKGADGWIEIFRAGTHTDSGGRTKEFTVADLDRIVAGFDPAKHEPPVVIGHPRDNAPAWAWVDGVKRVGNSLYYRERATQPEFDELRKREMFKKRSISLYADGTLKHVGWLGATPPAVKGLRDVVFNDDDSCREYEFEESPQGMEGTMPTVEELRAELAREKEAREQAEAKAREYKENADRVTADFAEAEAKRKKREIADFVEQGIKAGTMLPSWKEAGIVEFMQAIDGGAQTFEFTEGKTESPGKWFRGFLESFSAHPLFKSMTTPAGDGKGSSDFAEDEALAKQIAASTGAKVD